MTEKAGYVKHFLLMVALVVVGCASSTATPERKAREQANLHRVDTTENESDVMHVTTRVSIATVKTSTIAATVSEIVVPARTEFYVWKSSAESMVHIARIREIDDNPLGVAVAIMAHAHGLMLQAEEQLDKNELPPQWFFDRLQPLLIEAHGYVEQIEKNSFEEQYALDCKDLVWNRYISALTKLNEAKAAAR